MLETKQDAIIQPIVRVDNQLNATRSGSPSYLRAGYDRGFSNQIERLLDTVSSISRATTAASGSSTNRVRFPMTAPGGMRMKSLSPLHKPPQHSPIGTTTTPQHDTQFPSLPQSQTQLISPSPQQKPSTAATSQSLIKHSTQLQLKKVKDAQTKNIHLIKSVTNLSGLMYVMGSHTNELLDIIEKRESREKIVQELIERSKCREFLALQRTRINCVQTLKTIFFDQLLLSANSTQSSSTIASTSLQNALSSNKGIFNEISAILAQETTSIFTHFELFIATQDDNFNKMNIFQDKEVLLITDFQHALTVLMDTYNCYFQQLESFGKTEEQRSADMKSLFQFKSILKADSKNQKVAKLFEDLEELLKSNYEKMDEAFIRIGKLTKENDDLTLMCKQLQHAKSEYSWKIIQLQKGNISDFNNPSATSTNQAEGENENQQLPNENNTINNNNPNSAQFQAQPIASGHAKILEEYYLQTIENLRNENKRLSENLQKQGRKIQLFNNLKDTGTGVGTSSKDKYEGGIGNNSGNPSGNGSNNVNGGNNNNGSNANNPNASNYAGTGNNGGSNDPKMKIKQYYSQDKQIQCTFLAEKNPVVKREFDFCQIMISPIFYLKSATIQPKEWTLMITNVILSDKLLSDILDEQDLRPTVPLHLYVCEWFLKKFGNKDIAESLLKDYLISLKKYGKLNERFKIFCEMCGLDELLESDSETASYSYNNNNAYAVSIGLNRQKFKKMYMRTSESLTMLHKVAYLVRMSGKNFFGSSTCLPLFPNVLQRCLDLISNDYSMRIWETIIAEENLNKLDLSSLETKFKRVVQQDLIQRQNDPLAVYSGASSDSQEEGFIRFDTMCRCILETVIDQRIFELEGVYSSLKLKSNPRYECQISFTDFTKIVSKILPKKTSRWLEIAYREFTQGIVTEKTPLNMAIMRLIPFLANEDCVKPNFLKIKNIISKANNESIQHQQGASNNAGSHHPSSQTDEITSKKGSSVSSQLQSNSITGKKSVTSITKSPSKTGSSSAAVNHNSITNGSPAKHATSNASNAGVSSQMKLIDFKVEMQKFKDRIIHLYDPVSQLALLEESYKIMIPIIKQLEKKNSNLLNIHASIKEDFAILPTSVAKQVRYDQFELKKKEDLMASIDSAWDKFRKILTYNNKS